MRHRNYELTRNYDCWNIAITIFLILSLIKTLTKHLWHIWKPMYPGGPAGQIGLSYRAARLHRLAESIPWNGFLGSLNVYNLGLWFSLFCLIKRESHKNSIFCKNKIMTSVFWRLQNSLMAIPYIAISGFFLLTNKWNLFCTLYVR